MSEPDAVENTLERLKRLLAGTESTEDVRSLKEALRRLAVGIENENDIRFLREQWEAGKSQPQCPIL